jgi:tRNA pseudouridine38-40 synthase
MPRYALTLALSGTHYAGTAIQPAHTPTLHRHLVTCFDQLQAGSGESLQCCSRLDSGVAAKAFTVHIDLDAIWAPADLVKALNGLLRWPNHKRHAVALSAATVHVPWDAWRSAESKVYDYHILISAVPPLHHERCLWLRRPLHLDSLKACAAAFLGEHDLSGLAALRKDASDAFQPSRSVLQSQWQAANDQRGNWLTYTVEGTGFLYKQVRGMVGAMCHLAQNPDAAEAAKSLTSLIKASRSGKRLGEIVGPDGLELRQVNYGKNTPKWQSPTLNSGANS